MAAPKKEEYTYDMFLRDVPLQQRPYVDELHAFLTGSDCQVRVKPATSSYVVSYDHRPSGKVLAIFVLRKKGAVMRAYGDHVGQYEALLETFPQGMRKAIAKAPSCRRLMDPAACNARCAMGNLFHLEGEEYKKCRYSNFLILVEEESAPGLRALLEKEIEARQNEGR